MRNLFSAIVVLIAVALAPLASTAQVNLARLDRISAQTATATLDASQVGSNTLLTNQGATGAIVLSLPDCDSSIPNGPSSFQATTSTVGLVVNVLLTVAQDVDLNPGTDSNTALTTTDTIVGMGTLPSTAVTGSGGDAVSSAAAIGNAISLVCAADDRWVIVSAAGAWTDVN